MLHRSASKRFVAFRNPFNSDLPQQFWYGCKNCSFMTGEPIGFPCVHVGAPIAFPWWLAYVGAAGNLSSLPFVGEVNVTLVKPDKSEFEIVNETWGFAMQAILSVWTLANMVFAAAFLLQKLERHWRDTPVLAVLTLALEWICNTWRFTLLVIDPWLTNGFYPEWYFAFIGGYIYSLSLCATLFIALFWFRHTFLRRTADGSVVTLVLACLGGLLSCFLLFSLISFFGSGREPDCFRVCPAHLERFQPH